jgi:hypothetical protein
MTELGYAVDFCVPAKRLDILSALRMDSGMPLAWLKDPRPFL